MRKQRGHNALESFPFPVLSTCLQNQEQQATAEWHSEGRGDGGYKVEAEWSTPYPHFRVFSTHVITHGDRKMRTGVAGRTITTRPAGGPTPG